MDGNDSSRMGDGESDEGGFSIGRTIDLRMNQACDPTDCAIILDMVAGNIDVERYSRDHTLKAGYEFVLSQLVRGLQNVDLELGALYANVFESAVDISFGTPPTEDDITAWLGSVEATNMNVNSLKVGTPFLAESLDNLNLSPEWTVNMMAKPLLTLRQIIAIRDEYYCENCKVGGKTTPVMGPYRLADYTIMSCSGFYLAERERGGAKHLFSHSVLLMMLATVECRTTALEGTIRGCGVDQHSMVPTEVFRSYMGWGTDLLKKYDSKAYSVISAWESMLTAVASTTEGHDTLELGCHYNMKQYNSVLGTCLEYGIDLQDGLAIFDSDWSSALSLAQRLELFGAAKFFGNPDIDPKQSGDAVQKHCGPRAASVSNYTSWRLRAASTRAITLEFLAKEGRLPVLHVLEGYEDTPLGRALSVGGGHVINEQAPGHKFDHWMGVRFGCNVPHDDHRHYSLYLDDKSLGVFADCVSRVYNQNLLEIWGAELLETERRLILEYLRTDPIPIAEILTCVMRGEIPMRWLSIRLVAKVGEMKWIRARLFAILVLAVRMYFAVTEHMLKDHVFKYFKHQTMSVGDSQERRMVKEIRHQTSFLNSEERLPHLAMRGKKFLICAHIWDYVKWNLNMRNDNCMLCFEMLDDFCGSQGLFASTHHIFSNSIIHVGSYNGGPLTVQGAYDPSSLTWYHHVSGFEGQRQKGWLIPTQAMFELAEQETGVGYLLCGQGDNQVAISFIPIPSEYSSQAEWTARSPETARAAIMAWRAVIERLALESGLKTKDEECFGHMTLVNWSKEFSDEGIMMPQVLKRLSKAESASTGVFPSLMEFLNDSQSSSFTMANADLTPFLAVCIPLHAQARTIMSFLKRHPLGGRRLADVCLAKRVPIDASLIKDILSMTSTAGGYNAVDITSLSMRQFPDSLHVNLASILSRAESGDIFSRRLVGALMSGVLEREGEPRLSRLIENPGEPNIPKMTNIMGFIEDATMASVRRFSNNTEVNEIFGVLAEQEYNDAVENSLAERPFNPWVIGARLACLSYSKAKAMTKQMVNRSTENRLNGKCFNEAPYITTMRNEEREFSGMIDRLLLIRAHEAVPCDELPTAARLYDMIMAGWGVEPVTGLPHPSNMFRMTECPHGVCTAECRQSENECICFSLLPDQYYGRGGTLCLSRGLLEGYEGSMVEEMLEGASATLNIRNLPLEAGMTLHKIGNWAYGGVGEGAAQARAQAESVSDASVALLDALVGYASRVSYHHRLHLMKMSKGTFFCGIDNVKDFIAVSTNRMGQYSRGEFNYNFAIGYGPAILYGIYAIRMLAVLEDIQVNSPRRHFHMHILSPDSVRVVDDRPIELVDKTSIQILRSSLRSLYTEIASLPEGAITYRSAESNFGWQPTTEGEVRAVCAAVYANRLVRQSRGFVGTRILPGEISPPGSVSSSASILQKIHIMEILKQVADIVLMSIPFSLTSLASVDLIVSATVSALPNGFLRPLAERMWMRGVRNQFVSDGGTLTTYDSISIPAGAEDSLLLSLTRLMSERFDICTSQIYPIMVGTTHNSMIYVFTQAVHFRLVRMAVHARMSVSMANHYSQVIGEVVRSLPEGREMDAVFMAAQLLASLEVDHLPRGLRSFCCMPPMISPTVNWIARLATGGAPTVVGSTTPFVPVLTHCLNFLIDYPGDMLYHTNLELEIRQPVRQPEQLPVAHYFRGSGLHSTSVAPIGECLAFLEHQDIKGLISVGSSSGEDAFLVCSLPSIEDCFITSLRGPQDYIAHAYIDTVPARFVNSDLEEKVYGFDESLMNSVDFTLEDASSTLASLTQGRHRDLILITIENSDFTVNDQMAVVRNGVLLSDLVKSSCCIIEVFYNCEEDLAAYSNTLSGYYSVQHFVKPHSAPEGNGLMYLVCSVPRPKPSLLQYLRTHGGRLKSHSGNASCPAGYMVRDCTSCIPTVQPDYQPMKVFSRSLSATVGSRFLTAIRQLCTEASCFGTMAEVVSNRESIAQSMQQVMLFQVQSSHTFYTNGVASNARLMLTSLRALSTTVEVLAAKIHRLYVITRIAETRFDSWEHFCLASLRIIGDKMDIPISRDLLPMVENGVNNPNVSERSGVYIYQYFPDTHLIVSVYGKAIMESLSGVLRFQNEDQIRMGDARFSIHGCVLSRAVTYMDSYVEETWPFRELSQADSRSKGYHWGQRKLMITEIRFLTECVSVGGSDMISVLYAGCRPGWHISGLLDLFPTVKILGIDLEPPGSDLHPRFEYAQMRLEDVPPETFQMVDHMIADIGTSRSLNEISDHLHIMVEAGRKVRRTSMIKLRLDHMEDSILIPEGDIHLSPWRGRFSDECRLVFDSGAHLRFLNTGLMRRRMYYFNRHCRTSVQRGRESLLIACPCHDCNLETAILQRHLEVSGSATPIAYLSRMVSIWCSGPLDRTLLSPSRRDHLDH